VVFTVMGALSASPDASTSDTRAGELERELAELEATSALPEAPEEARVEEWMLDGYRRSWRQ
jgi:hypothetical protein